MKNTFYYSTIAAILSGCSSTRTPDRIEVLHAQPLTTEYEVKKGDTINKIAIAHSMSPERLVAINRINPPYLITVGQKLKIDNEDTDMIVVKQIFYN